MDCLALLRQFDRFVGNPVEDGPYRIDIGELSTILEILLRLGFTDFFRNRGKEELV